MGWTGWHGPREEGLIRDDIMLAYLYHPGAVSGQHTPRSVWEISEGQRMQTDKRMTARTIRLSAGIRCSVFRGRSTSGWRSSGKCTALTTLSLPLGWNLRLSAKSGAVSGPGRAPCRGFPQKPLSAVTRLYTYYPTCGMILAARGSTPSYRDEGERR